MKTMKRFSWLQITYFIATIGIFCLLTLPFSATAEEGHEGHDHGAEVSKSGEKKADDDKEHNEANHVEEAGHEGHDHAAEESEFPIMLSAEGIKMAGIKMSIVAEGCIGRTIGLPGEIGFNEDRLVHIAPRFPGIAKEARFRVGDYVKAGKVMAVIESNESMSSYNIMAPISGWIIEKHITTGEFVSGESSLYVLADLSKVWVNLAVYPKDASMIKRGMKVKIEAIGTDLATEGTIAYVTPILDVTTRSITARVILANPDNQWRPGTFVHALVNAEFGDEGLVIEKNAVQILDNEKFVFISNGKGGFRPVPVETGEQNQSLIRIISGLGKGDSYVSSGAFELKAKIVTSSLGGHAGHGH